MGATHKRITGNKTMRTVKFQYLFGGNIELDVIAKISGGRDATATSPREYPEADIHSVKLSGTDTDVEVDDILISLGRSSSSEELLSILEREALEAETVEEIFAGI
jgi:hypothetical protein